MRATTREGIGNRTDLSLEDIAREFNPILRGWINYYGKYNRSVMNSVLKHFNAALARWVMRKYKRYKQHKKLAAKFIKTMARNQPQLFVHWKMGIIEVFA